MFVKSFYVNKIMEDLNHVLYKEFSTKIDMDLRMVTLLSKKVQQNLGTFRGIRYKRNLPCRGQRTHTNARTLKGFRLHKYRKKIKK